MVLQSPKAPRKGDVLFRLDPRQFHIALDNAKSQLAQGGLTINAMALIAPGAFGSV